MISLVEANLMSKLVIFAGVFGLLSWSCYIAAMAQVNGHVFCILL